jgi:ribosomal protein S2
MKKATDFNRNKTNPRQSRERPQFFRHLNLKQIESLQTPFSPHKSNIVDTLAEKHSKPVDLKVVAAHVNQRFARAKKTLGRAEGSILPSHFAKHFAVQNVRQNVRKMEVLSLPVEDGISLPVEGSLSKKKRLHNQLLQFLKSSSHFGRKSRHLDFAFPWHASMSNKLLGVRNKVAHINAQETFQSLVEAFYCIALVLRKGGKVLVINKNNEFSSLFYPHNLDSSVLQAKHTRPSASKNPLFQNGLKQNLSPSCKPLEQASNLQSQEKGFQDFANTSRQFACERQRPATAPLKWVGGCLTNWKEISKSVATLLYFSKRFGAFINQNNIHFPRFKKIKNSFQGFINREKEQLLLKERPQLLFLFNAYESQQILHEAIRLQIPVVALTDSSTDLSQITYPIPINSNSADLVYWCFSQLIQIIERQEMVSTRKDNSR